MYTISLDVSTAALPSAATFLEDPVADRRLKDPQKIADDLADKRQGQLDKAALDPDLCIITGAAAIVGPGEAPTIWTAPDEKAELLLISELAELINDHRAHPVLIGYNSLKFDWPVLVRRARYLGVKLSINCDRYKSPHKDVCDILTNHGQLPFKTLGFYVKRLGWTDLAKPLSGAEEAKVLETRDWDGLYASLLHDVVAVKRLAVWLDLIPRSETLAVA